MKGGGGGWDLKEGFQVSPWKVEDKISEFRALLVLLCTESRILGTCLQLELVFWHPISYLVLAFRSQTGDIGDIVSRALLLQLFPKKNFQREKSALEKSFVLKITEIPLHISTSQVFSKTLEMSSKSKIFFFPKALLFICRQLSKVSGWKIVHKMARNLKSKTGGMENNEQRVTKDQKLLGKEKLCASKFNPSPPQRNDLMGARAALALIRFLSLKKSFVNKKG